ncbi:DUF4180 domain-containing protein [Burkholderia sp. ABCPW 14]|uniref:DUF4180 domain-containing protein n=1 Tax=Burkholderia sp. ABCPW 14 TaxID=1637860 RepID=UPI001E3948BE|nr:DUF4180 domain-containing protein [Burkholderia sp. ABCPW 14]
MPAEPPHDDFFRLDTCVAGHLVQKLINYGVKLAVVGDIDAPLARSRALRALVRETNRAMRSGSLRTSMRSRSGCASAAASRTRRVNTR